MSDSTPLPSSSPEAQGVPSRAIVDFLEAVAVEPGGIHSIMLLRHGHLIAKGWWAPYAESDPHMLFSLSKSFTSTAVGLAESEGLLSIDDRVISYFPNEAPEVVSDNLAAMRIRHLLSMSTGHVADTMQHLRDQPDDNWARAFLTQPVVREPGTYFLYNSGASYMLSAIVQKLTGQTLVDYLTPRLFMPLGIVAPTWQSCPRGINVGGWGMSCPTEGIARFGQLYLQKGMWQGERLLPESWVERATAYQVSNAGSGVGEFEGGETDNDTDDWAQGYGFQFWRCRHNAYRGDGAFGQFCIVMPEQDAVLAITSGANDMQAVLDQVWTHLLPAMGGEPLAESAREAESLAHKLEALTLPAPTGEALSSMAKQVSGRTYVFETNMQGLTSLAFDFDGPICTLTRRHGDMQSQIVAEYGVWQSGAVFPFDGAYSPAAAAGGWVEPAVYEMAVCFTQAPFRLTTTCRFKGETLVLDEALNVSFGPTEFPQIVGHLQ